MKARALGIVLVAVILCCSLAGCTAPKFALLRSRSAGPIDSFQELSSPGTPATALPGSLEEPPSPTGSGEALVLSDTWYFYNWLDSIQQEVYMGLYDSLTAYIKDDTSTEPFTYTCENPGPTINGQDIVEYVSFDHPILAQYFASYVVAEENDTNTLFRDIRTPDLQVFGDYTDIRGQISEIEAAANEFLSAIDPSLSDYERYFEIAAKLCGETKYDYGFGAQGQTVKDFLLDVSVYGGLVNHLCVCQGFSKTYQYLCQRAGLFCMGIAGRTDSGDHEWNIIKLDDGYYHVDITWMQANRDRYFCLSDEQIFADHIIISQYHPECSGQKHAYDGGRIPQS